MDCSLTDEQTKEMRRGFRMTQGAEPLDPCHPGGGGVEGNEHISMDLHMHTQADALYKHCWAHMCHS